MSICKRRQEPGRRLAGNERLKSGKKETVTKMIEIKTSSEIPTSCERGSSGWVPALIGQVL